MANVNDVKSFNLLNAEGVIDLVKKIFQESDQRYVRQGSIDTATPDTDGLMSAEDKALLNDNSLTQDQLSSLSALLD